MKAAADSDKQACLLVLNSGSSSLKFALLEMRDSGLRRILRGETERIGHATSATRAHAADGRMLLNETGLVPDHAAALLGVLACLQSQKLPSPTAIGHRIVHGGAQLREHRLIDEPVLEALQAAAAFAPLHAPAALAVIHQCRRAFPGLPQVACLDTSFHARMPAEASTLPLPRELRAAGIQRYGFHGLSCESIVHQLADLLPRRLVIAHLGSGASITAVRDGRSIDTSMGLTPTGGLMMGTRSGDLDPGVMVHLLRDKGFDAGSLEQLLNEHSGLLGLSGVSADMRLLHEAAPANSDAQLAIQMLGYAVAKSIGAMAIALGGVDSLVFTGGIGEHDAVIRHEVCARLACLGIELDDALNGLGKGLISGSASGCSVRVLQALEDEQIARHTWALCGHQR